MYPTTTSYNDSKDLPGLVSRRRILSLAISSAALFTVKASLAEELAVPDSISDAIRPFRVKIPEADLSDLKLRLRQTRWPEKESVGDWTQGVPLQKAKDLATAWERNYDWRIFERRINRLPQFLTKIDGLDIHFIHVKSGNANALPILLTHGWPGSFAEFLDCIGPLTNPVRHGGQASDAFDVIIPSLPGYGFSGKPIRPGWDVEKTARAWVTLMDRLGYINWVAQGGDWGASVTTTLGEMRPKGIIGIHLNWAFVFPESIPADLTRIPSNLSSEELRAVEQAKRFKTEGIGYFRHLSTKPQTAGYALSDSPAALATFIYEKFHSWSDNDGNPEDALSVTAMLDNISLYWLSRSGASASRFYWENPGNSFAGPKLDLPVAVSVFPREIYQVPRSWAENTFSNLVYFNEVERGGHFAAMEQPVIFSAELRKAFRKMRG